MKKHFYRIIGVMIFSAILMSCKKDEIIEDDGCLYSDKYDEFGGDTMGKMPGMWEWVYSVGPCGTQYYNYCYSSPQTEGYTLSLMFDQNGEYKKYINDSLVEDGGVTIYIYTPDTNPGGTQFSIQLIDCLPKEGTVGRISGNDTLRLGHYPFEYDGSNVFVRK